MNINILACYSLGGIKSRFLTRDFFTRFGMEKLTNLKLCIVSILWFLSFDHVIGMLKIDSAS